MQIEGYMPFSYERKPSENDEEYIEKVAKSFRSLWIWGFVNGYVKTYKNFRRNLKAINDISPVAANIIEEELKETDDPEKDARIIAVRETEGYVPGFKQGYIIGYDSGGIYGLKKGRLMILCELVNDNVLTIEQAAEREEISVEDFKTICADELKTEDCS